MRPETFRKVPVRRVQQALEDTSKTVRPIDYNAFDYAARHYSYLRSFLPYILEALSFTGTAAAAPVLKGIEVLVRVGKKKLPPDAPVGFVGATWRSVVILPDGTLNRATWELCLAHSLRHVLRTSRSPGSRQPTASGLDELPPYTGCMGGSARELGSTSGHCRAMLMHISTSSRRSSSSGHSTSPWAWPSTAMHRLSMVRSSCPRTTLRISLPVPQNSGASLPKAAPAGPVDGSAHRGRRLGRPTRPFHPPARARR